MGPGQIWRAACRRSEGAGGSRLVGPGRLNSTRNPACAHKLRACCKNGDRHFTVALSQEISRREHRERREIRADIVLAAVLCALCVLCAKRLLFPIGNPTIEKSATV